MKKIFIAIIIVCSVSLNVFFLYINVFPLFKNEPQYLSAEISQSEYEKLILKGAIEMLQSDEVIMPTRRQSDFKEEVLNLMGKGRKHSFFFYPRAYLYTGITQYARAKGDTLLINKYRNRIDAFITSHGSPSFEFNVVDQVPFGMVALNMYSITGDEKYKIFSDSIMNFLKSKDTPDGILYRENEGNHNQHNDVLGLVCPFISQYAQMFNDSAAYDLNIKQMKDFVRYGIDTKSNLPVHGFNRDHGYQVGAANWGRGMGWYAMGLASVSDSLSLNELEANRFCESITRTELPQGGYTQYPGSCFSFDSSTTVMIRYALRKLGYTDNKDIVRIMAPYTDKNGWIAHTSGDTYGFNMYSYTFGYSELTQGVMLMILSEL